MTTATLPGHRDTDARDFRGRHPSGYRLPCPGQCTGGTPDGESIDDNEATLNANRLVIDQEHFDPQAGGNVARVRVFCPNCQRLFTWTAAIDLSGRPTAVRVGPLKSTRDRRKIDDFREQYPHAVDPVEF